MSDYYSKPFSKYLAINRRILNLLGLCVGKLIVLQFVGQDKWRHAQWLCLCSCGNITIVAGGNLSCKAKHPTRSCGCVVIDGIRKRSITHGDRRGRKATPEYTAYAGAKGRCNRPSSPNYHQYGGRGIQFLFHSFDQFLAIVGRKPSPRHSLDRFPNKNGNYEPGNVRWATALEQTRNKRNTLMITAHGKSQSTQEWHSETGINQNRLWCRKRQLGWCDQCTVTPNLRRCEHRVLPAEKPVSKAGV